MSEGVRRQGRDERNGKRGNPPSLLFGRADLPDHSLADLVALLSSLPMAQRKSRDLLKLQNVAPALLECESPPSSAGESLDFRPALVSQRSFSD